MSRISEQRATILTDWHFFSQSYLDFHSELFPPVQDYQNAAQDAKAWLNGQDAPPALVTPQPGKTWGGAAASQKPKQAEEAAPKAIDRAKVQTAASTSGALGTQAPTPVSVKNASLAAEKGHKAEPVVDSAPVSRLSEMTVSDSKASPASSVSTTNIASVAAVRPGSSPETSASSGPPALTNNDSKSNSTSAPQQATTSVSKPSAKQHAHWSRSFLAGKTHLKPDYEDVHNISNTTSASVQLLKANMKYLFYPLSGPGGRLAYHQVEKKGRLPVHIQCITSGHDIVDFALDPFEESRVFIAGSDGKIRVFQVKEGSSGEGEDLSEASAVLDGKFLFSPRANP